MLPDLLNRASTRATYRRLATRYGDLHRGLGLTGVATAAWVEQGSATKPKTLNARVLAHRPDLQTLGTSAAECSGPAR